MLNSSPPKIRFTTLIIVLTLVITIIPILLIGLSTFASARNALVDQARSFTNDLLQNRRQHLDGNLASVSSVANRLTSRYIITGYGVLDTSESYSFLEKEKIIQNLRTYIGIQNIKNIDILYPDGSILTTRSAVTPATFYSEDVIRDIFTRYGGAESDQVFTGVLSEKIVNRPERTLYLVSPILETEDNNSVVIAITVVTFTIEIEPSASEEELSMQPGSILLDRESRILSVDAPSYMTSLMDGNYLKSLDQENGYFTDTVQGKTYLFSYMRLSNPDAYLITSLPLASLMSLSSNMTWTILLIILVCAVLTFFIIFGTVWFVYKPFKEIITSITNFRNGTPDWSMRFRSFPIQELDTLSNWFNSYIEAEHGHFQTEEALADSERRYHSLFDDSPIPLWEEDFSDVISGLDEIGLEGQALDDYLSLHPELVVRLISKLKITDVNQASMIQYKAISKQQMIDQTAQIFHNVNVNLVRRELVQMANRTRIFELELENCTFANEVLMVRMRWSVFPGYEQNMGRVIVSTTDITREVKDELLRSTVMQITQETSNAETLNDLYKSIHSTLAKIMPADNLYIALYDDESGMVSFPYFVDQYDDPPGPHPFGNGWTEYVIRTGKASLLSRDQVVKLQEEEGINNNGADSIDWLGVPLNVKDRTIGVLAVQTYETGTRYTQEHCDWLTFVSTQIAMAIDRKKAEEALKFSSTHDKLTGLYNRAYFEEEVNRLSAGRQNPVGVIIMDVDGLKRTNDTYGHSAGDDLLQATSKVLQQAFRSNDMVARIGGDEFVVLLPYSTGLVVEKAIQRIEKYLVRYNHNGHIEVSLSLGSACTEDGNSLSDTIKLADQRMYEEKNRRRAKSILPNS